jgi:hypothetical protein
MRSRDCGQTGRVNRPAFGERWGDAATEIGSPIYGVGGTGNTPRRAGFGGAGGNQSVTVAYGRAGMDTPYVEVQTSSSSADSGDNMLLVELTGRLADPSFPVTFDRREMPLLVDGEPVPFVVVEGGGSWVAVCRLRDHGIKVVGWGCRPADFPIETVNPASVQAARDPH